MYNIRCRDIMELNSIAMPSGSVTKQCSGQNGKTTQNRLTQNSIIKKYHLHKNGTEIVIEMNMV